MATQPKRATTRDTLNDPKAGSISFVSPVARSLMGKAVGDVVGAAGQELEITAIE